MDIKITGIHEAQRVMDGSWPTHVISIINDPCEEWPGTTMVPRDENHHVFNFHDVEDRDSQVYRVPSLQDMRDIMAVTAQIPSDARLLIHCTAGKSRSPAIALGVQIQHGMTPKEAFQWTKAHRDCIFPNRLMIEYLDEVLECQGELIKVIEAYYRDSLFMFPLLVEQGRGGYNR